MDRWLERFRRSWDQHLDALASELARGERDRRLRGNFPPSSEDPAADPEEDE